MICQKRFWQLFLFSSLHSLTWGYHSSLHGPWSMVPRCLQAPTYPCHSSSLAISQGRLYHSCLSCNTQNINMELAHLGAMTTYEYIYVRNSIKGHNSRTLWQNLTWEAGFIWMTWKLWEEFETQHLSNRHSRTYCLLTPQPTVCLHPNLPSAYTPTYCLLTPQPTVC